MARFSRFEVLNTMIEIRLVPVFHHKDPDVAKKIVASCAAGGLGWWSSRTEGI